MHDDGTVPLIISLLCFIKKIVNFSALFDRNNLTKYINNATQFDHQYPNRMILKFTKILAAEIFFKLANT